MLKISSLNFFFETDHVLKDISFEVEKGSFVGIVGPNGAGKSTLLKAILGFVDMRSGSVELDGAPIAQELSRVAYVSQSNSFDWQFPLSVLQLIELSLLDKKNFWRFDFSSELDHILKVLDDLKIKDLKDRHISELSGGQKQRVLLARVLCQPFDLLILDEPFIGVDHKSEEIIMSLLRKIQSLGKTIVMVHHNLNTVKGYFVQVLFLNKSVLAFGDVEDVFNKENLQRTYQGEIYL